MSRPGFPGKLIVHVGDHKAGSTSIQNGLARGIVRLKHGTLSYPLLADKVGHNHLGRVLEAEGVKRFSLKRKPSNPEGFAKVAQIAREARPDVTVLSAEDFEGVAPAKLHAVLNKHFPVEPGALTLVAYLRPHPGRVISGLAERIKIGWAKNDPWEGISLSARLKLRYAPRVAAWRKEFSQAYIPRPMIREALVGGSLLDDLFATALGPGQVEVREDRRANESLGVEDLMRLHVIHGALPQLSKWQHHGLGWALADHLAAAAAPDTPGTPLRIHKALAEDLFKGLGGDARKIDAEVCGGQPLFTREFERVLDTALPERMSLRPEDWLEPGEIRSLRALAALIADMTDAKGWNGALRSARVARVLAP
jgi:hypothetical protein